MSNDCDKLDDFLAGELSADAAAHFSSHLRDCEACREAESEQRWIDGLLTSPERMHLEPAPRTLLDAILVTRTPKPQFNRKIVLVALASAATILVAAGWIIFANRQAEDHATSLAAAPAGVSESAEKKTEVVSSTFIADSNAIAVPVESHRPGVTIVRVYPTFQPQVETQTAALESADATNINDIWSAYSNGG